MQGEAEEAEALFKQVYELRQKEINNVPSSSNMNSTSQQASATAAAGGECSVGEAEDAGSDDWETGGWEESLVQLKTAEQLERERLAAEASSSNGGTSKPRGRGTSKLAVEEEDGNFMPGEERVDVYRE